MNGDMLMTVVVAAAMVSISIDLNVSSSAVIIAVGLLYISPVKCEHEPTSIRWVFWQS